MKDKLIAYCGLYCPKCYKMTISEAAINLKKELDNKQGCGKLNCLSESFKLELDELIALRCNKICKDGGGSLDCKIRKCCIEKSFDGCWECNDFESCDKLSLQFVENLKSISNNAALKLKQINVENYLAEKENLFLLAEKIWKDSESYNNIKLSIERWGESKSESGGYFYILDNEEIIGLTGYFIPDLSSGAFGLRHHGTIIKGTGKIVLDLLVDYLKIKYGNSFKYLIEFIPEGKPELIKKFKEWGFALDPNGVPDWEPRKEYYKYSMIRYY